MDEAFRWYSASVEPNAETEDEEDEKDMNAQVSINASFKLGRCHHHGMGTPKDMKKAVEYYTFAAEKGHVKGR